MMPDKTVTRRTMLQALGVAAVGAPLSALAQGRCMLTFGTPACNTTGIAPIFEPTGWKTVGLDHITFRTADYRKEAAFYIALMGWTLRSDDGRQAVLDMGDWGSAIFRQAAPESFAAPDGGRGRGNPVTVVVESFSFAIDQWNAANVEAALRKRGLTPVADNDGRGFESFRVKDPDGWDLQISNGNGLVKSRKTTPASATWSEPAPFAPTGWKTVWLDHFSFNASDYKKSVSFYTNLLGWTPTYDEGSQNELLMGEVGDIIVRGGNPLDPGFRQGRRAPRRDRSHLVRHRPVGHGRRESGAREARPEGADRYVEPAPRAGRHVGTGRDSHGRVQELSHGDAQRLQPADQLRDARQPAGAAERGQAEAVRRPVSRRSARHLFASWICVTNRST